MFKKINIILILSLLFISVTAVSAVEDADMNLTSDEIIVDNLESIVLIIILTFTVMVLIRDPLMI